MKKQVLTFGLIVCFLVACQSEPLQLNTLDTLPDGIETVVTNERVQLITHGDDTYIVVRAAADIEATFDIVAGTLQLHFHTVRSGGEERIHRYEIVKGNAQYDRIELYVDQQRIE